MRIRSIAAGTMSLLGILLMSGCDGGGGSSTSTPTPTSTPSNAGSGDTTQNGAPKVKTPLAWDSFKSAPCTVITVEQLAALGVPGVTGKVNPSAPGPACIWQGTSVGDRITPGVAFPQGNGLDAAYEQKATFAYFEPQPDVQGYPALLASVADNRTKGDCTLAVGISDTQVANFTVQMATKAPRYSDPCGLVTEIANQVIKNIKAGAK